MAECVVKPHSEGHYDVSYVPMEVGDYSVIVRWNGRDVQGPHRIRMNVFITQ